MFNIYPFGILFQIGKFSKHNDDYGITLTSRSISAWVAGSERTGSRDDPWLLHLTIGEIKDKTRTTVIQLRPNPSLKLQVSTQVFILKSQVRELIPEAWPRAQGLTIQVFFSSDSVDDPTEDTAVNPAEYCA